MFKRLEKFILAETGLTFDEALSALSTGQRALLVAKFNVIYRKEKNAWLSVARSEFQPGRPEPCAICGAYKSVSHAHHTFPLYLQFEKELVAADHSFVWLCPTHHVAVHRYIDAALATRQPLLEGFTPDELDAIDRHAAIAIRLWFT